MLGVELLTRLVGVLDEHDIPYMATGSIVSSLQGDPRSTQDIDLVVNITEASIPVLVSAFPTPPYYLSKQGIRDALKHLMFNLLEPDTGLKVDFWILTQEAYDVSRFERRVETDFFGLKLHVSSPEDTILMKLKWASIAGGS